MNRSFSTPAEQLTVTSPIMAIQKDFVLVHSELFSRMRLHCEHCNDFDIPLQDLSDGRVVASTANLRKRKTAQPIGSTQSALINNSTPMLQSRTEAIKPRPLSRVPGTGSLLQSNSESPVGPLSELPKKKQKKSRKILALDRFVQNAPQGNGWRARQSKLGLNTAEEYEDVIRRFSRSACVASKKEYFKELGDLSDELITVGERLATLTKSSLENSHLQRSFAYFQVLILLSYCEILRQKGISGKAIDGLIQTITQMRENDRKSLLDTVPWIHQLIVELVRRGWTLYRATELFFLSMLRISDF